MTWLSACVIALAINQIVEIWQHSVLFDDARQTVNKYYDDTTSLSVSRVCQMLLCPWCFSVWVAGGVLLLYYHDQEWLLWPFGLSRAANLINDLAYGYLRTPKNAKGIEIDNSLSDD